MKIAKISILAIFIFLVIILTDGNAKTFNGNDVNSEKPRHRIILVERHCYVRPVIIVAPRHYRKHFWRHHRRIMIIR